MNICDNINSTQTVTLPRSEAVNRAVTADVSVHRTVCSFLTKTHFSSCPHSQRIHEMLEIDEMLGLSIKVMSVRIV